MDTSGLVWPKKNWMRKENLLNFVNFWRIAKTCNSVIKTLRVRTIIDFLVFWPSLIWLSWVVLRVQNPLILLNPSPCAKHSAKAGG